MIATALYITKNLKLIKKLEFKVTALNRKNTTFIVYMVAVKTWA